MGSSAFETWTKNQGPTPIFQEQGSVPSERSLHQVIHIGLGPGHHRAGIHGYEHRQPDLVRSVFGGKLAKPAQGHLDLTRETLEAIKTVKP